MYDYVAGKMDWFAAGWPRESTGAGTDRIGDHARPDVPTAAPDEDAGALAARLGEWSFGVVVSGDRIVLGLADAAALGAAHGSPVVEVMSEGPTTYRAYAATEEVVGWMREADKTHVLVTDPEGRLLGVAERTELESAVARPDSG